MIMNSHIFGPGPHSHGSIVSPIQLCNKFLNPQNSTAPSYVGIFEEQLQNAIAHDTCEVNFVVSSITMYNM